MEREGFVSQVLDEVERRQIWVQRLLFLLLLGLFVGLLGLFFFLSESVAAEGGRFILFCYDVTGSTDGGDRLENERGLIRALDSLKPGDEGQIMLITENTFSKPEDVIRFKMPGEAGYFNEEIRMRKIQIIREFRQKIEKIRKSRAGTSLIDGMFMFTRLLNEHQGKRRILVIFSDMRQCLPGMNEDTIMTRGEEILSSLRGDGLIPDMRGIEVYCRGVSTANFSLKAWKKLEEFWRSYFSMAGATLKCYDMGRTRQID